LSEVLSQNEIDQLLAALSTGSADAALEPEEPQVSVRQYDFRTANKIPREQIRTLHTIHDNFARLVATHLTGTLGAYCDIKVVSVEEQSYAEFANSVSASSLLAIFKMTPLQGSVLLEMSPGVAYAILESLLGGHETPTENRRQFTEIDLVIMEKVIRQFMPLLNDAWNKVVKIKAVLDTLETSMQFAQIVSPNDTIAIITMSVMLGEEEDLINICIPQMAIEPVAKDLNVRVFTSMSPETIKHESYQDTIMHQLRSSMVPLKAVLSETTITVSDMINLQVGDVIQLEHKVGEPVKIEIGHIPRLSGVLGTRNNRYAVRVEEIINEEDSDDE
jgi:flagellar motor switch protein FliM